MSFLPASEQTQLIGHQAAEADFIAAWHAGRMPHAWLISGPAGIGKATFAYHAARWVLADDRAPSTIKLSPHHRLYAQINAGAAPGLLSIAAEEGEKGAPLAISIHQLRGGKDNRTDIRYKGIGDFLQLTPADGGWRVVVIDGADLLTEQAQNAVLKILEEPPARVLLLLTAAQPGRLLPTIRSRCRQLRLSPLAPEQLKLLARAQGLDVPSATLLQRAGGSVGELARLTVLDVEKLEGQIAPLVAALPVLDWQAVHELAAQLGRKGADAQLGLALELLQRELTRRAVAQPALARDFSVLQQRIGEGQDKHLQSGALVIDIFALLQRMAGSMVAA